MKTVSLSGTPRAYVGKKDAKLNRREGKVPCVIYGGKEQIHFTLPELAFNKILFTPEVYIIELEVDGKTYKTILQDVQYHPVNDKVLHADFLEIIEGKKLIVALPVKFKGVAPGVTKGGKLMVKYRKLRVKGEIEKMPEFIEVDISNLEIGQSVKVRDINLDGLTVVDTPNAVVVQVKMARGAKAAAAQGEEEAEGEE
jgi:large subunit ribosomal protein L25